MATRNHIGKTLYISPALPATHDTAGFEALTWTKVNGIQSLPQLGFEGANIDVADLQTGVTDGVKGAMSGVEATFACRKVSADAGQALVKTTAESPQGIGSIKIGRGSGADEALATGDPVQYAQGYFNGYKEMQGDTTTHEGFECTFRQNVGPAIEDVEPIP